jgi:hypothetical protein
METPTPESQTSRSPAWRVIRVILAIILPTLLLFLVGRSIVRQWHDVRIDQWQWHAEWLLASLIVGWSDFFLINQLWRWVLVTITHQRLGVWRAYFISAISNLGKYLPGRVWAFVSMFYLLRRDGFNVADAVASTVLHQAFTVVSGAVFILVVLGPQVFGPMPIVSVALGLGLCVLVLYPPLFTWAINLGLRLMRRDPIVVHYPPSRGIVLFVMYIVGWIMYGATTWLMLRGLGLDSGPFWPVVAAFVAGYLLGFLAIFAPGGLGVREGVLTVLLTPHFGSGLAATIAVVSRIWMTLLEVIQLSPLMFVGRRPTGALPVRGDGSKEDVSRVG